MLTEADFAGWLDRYKAAWEARDPDAAMALFAVDASYRETPFAAPMRGRAAIGDYWRDRVQAAQAAVAFSCDVLAVTGDTGLAHWRAQFDWRPTRRRVALDGIFLCRFRDGSDGDLRCAVLEEWWHRRAAESPGEGKLP